MTECSPQPATPDEPVAPLGEPPAPAARPPADHHFHQTHHRPKHPHRRMMYWIAVLAAVLVAFGGAIIAGVGLYHEAQPERPVRAYFAALQANDAKTALSYGNVPSGDRSFLTREVLRKQRAAAQLREVTLGAVNRVGRTATVAVSYEFVAGHGVTAHVEDAVPLVRDGYRWKLARVAQGVTITMSAGRDRATMAGAAVPSDRVLFFPGALPLQLDTDVLQVNIETSIVRFDAAPTMNVDLQVSDAGRQAVGAAVDAAVGRCAASNDQSRCPTSLNTVGYVPGSMRGSITTAPTANAMTITVQSEAAGLIDVVGMFQIDATWRELDFNNQAKSKSGPLMLRFEATLAPRSLLTVYWES